MERLADRKLLAGDLECAPAEFDADDVSTEEADELRLTDEVPNAAEGEGIELAEGKRRTKDRRDVNGDGLVTPLDALRIANALAAPVVAADDQASPDVDQDSRFTGDDFRQIVDCLNAQECAAGSETEAEPPRDSVVGPSRDRGPQPPRDEMDRTLLRRSAFQIRMADATRLRAERQTRDTDQCNDDHVAATDVSESSSSDDHASETSDKSEPVAHEPAVAQPDLRFQAEGESGSGGSGGSSGGSSGSGGAACQPVPMQYDTNKDGKVSPADVLQVIADINDGPPNQAVNDVNGDGNVDAKDVLEIINWMNRCGSGGSGGGTGGSGGSSGGSGGSGGGN